MQTLEASAEALALHQRINHTKAPYPKASSVAELFATVAARQTQAPALIHDQWQATYGQLNAAANRLAWQLLEAGVQPGQVVALNLPRSPQLIIALLAILKASAAYLPLDPSWPLQRIEELCHQTDCRWLLTGPEVQENARPARCQLLVPKESLASQVDPGNPPLRADGESIAYINFTSGSTGTPKGVPICHRGITRLVFNARYAKLDGNSRLLHMAPVTFDAATFEIWGALLMGGTCVLYPESFIRASRLQRLLQEQRINVMFLTTALFNTLIDEAPQALAGVATILTGGEAHSLRHMAKALDLYGPQRIVSVYGPTESTTFATYYPVHELHPEDTALPIGFALQNTRVYLLKHNRLCTAGETGELCLAGPGLSPGYLGTPTQRQEVFFQCLIGGHQELLYRTGDRCYLREDGALVFQGRLDDQVKINGHRIELAEVAYHFNRLPQVRQCFVTVAQSHLGENYLVAFVIPDNGHCEPQNLRQALSNQLPSYMVPARIQLCPSLPLSPTGKIDRRQLLSNLHPTGEIPHEHQ